MSRNTDLWNEFEKIRTKYKLDFWDEGGIVDLDNLDIEFTYDLLNLIDSRYAKKVRERINSVLIRKANKGVLPNGKLNFGYKRSEEGSIVIDKEKEPIVRMIFGYH